MRASLSYMVIVVALVLLPGMSHAQKDELRVGFSEHPPWKMLDKHGEPTGIDIELLRMLAQRMGLALSFHHYPFKRGLRMLELGDIDMMTGVLHRQERERYLHFLVPPYKTRSSKVFYVKKGREKSITCYEDLLSLKVGTGLGANYFPRFDSDDRIDKYPVNAADLNLRMLLAGRIDTFVMTESSGDYRIAAFGLRGEVTKAEFAHRESQGVYLVLSKSSRFADRLDEMEGVLAELIRAGVHDQLRTHFYEDLSGHGRTDSSRAGVMSMKPYLP